MELVSWLWAPWSSDVKFKQFNQCMGEDGFVPIQPNVLFLGWCNQYTWTEKGWWRVHVVGNYEVEPVPNQHLLPPLTPSERHTLEDGLTVFYENLSNHYLTACEIWANSILARWRDQLKRGIEEGNDPASYSNILKPTATTPAEKIALTYIWIVPCKIESVKTWNVQSSPISKAERQKQINETIIKSTQVSGSVPLIYFNGENNKQTNGTAVKLSKNGLWMVTLSNEEHFTVSDETELTNSKTHPLLLKDTKCVCQQMAW